MTNVEGRRYIPHVVHLSGELYNALIQVVLVLIVHPQGTIKQAQMAAITHNRTVIARYRAKAKQSGTYNVYSCWPAMMFNYISLQL